MIAKLLDVPYFIQYLFHKADNPLWCNKNRVIDFCIRFLCRWRNHPDGPIYYNHWGTEPDSRCSNCGDDLA